MRRVADVENIAERGFPIIIHAGFNALSPAIILHISKRVGRIDSRAGYEKGVNITQCSRVAEDWHVWSGAGYDEWDPREITKAVEHVDYAFAFCSSCGEPADFQEAHNAYWNNRDEERERRLEREEELAALMRSQWAAQEAELHHFLHAYVTADAPLVMDGKFAMVYKVPDSGVVIKLEADWEDE
jgi:hypothetical protein